MQGRQHKDILFRSLFSKQITLIPFSQVLDCTFTYSNSLDMKWGHNIGEPTGLIREIYDDRADLVMSTVGGHYYNYQVINQ